MAFPTRAPADPSPRLEPDPHRRRMRRLVVVIAAAAATVAGVLTVPPVRGTAGTAHQPALWAAALVLLLLPLIAGGAAAIGLAGPSPRPESDDGGTPPSRGARDRVAVADRVWRAVLPAFLVGYAALVLLTAGRPVLPASDASDVVPPLSPLTCYYPAAAVAATAVLPVRGRFAYVTALALPLTWTYPVHGGYPAQAPLEEVLVHLAFNLGTMGMLAWLLQQAADLDDSGARRRALVTGLRIDESRSRAQREADNFIHDHILSVLKAVPTVPAASPRLRRDADEALASLDEAAERRAPARSASELFRALGERLRAIGDDDVVVSSSIDQDPPVPRDTAQAFEDAAAEALRNSLAHAAGDPPDREATGRASAPDRETAPGRASAPGRACAPGRKVAGRITRTATLHSGPDGVVVTISDDGRGFDPERVPPGRHGVTGSIMTRMHDAGGTARIDTAPGTGTTVTLSWTNHAAPPTGPEPDSPGPGRATRREDSADPASTAASSPLSLSACMEAPITRVIAVCVLAICAHVLLLEAWAGSYRQTAPVIGCLGAMSAAALLTLRAWPEQRMPRWAAAWTAILIGVANPVVLFQIDVVGWPGCAAWCTSAGAALCCGLLARDRPWEAWAGLGLLVATSGVWALATGRDPAMILAWMAGQIIPVCLWRGVARLSVALTAATAENEAIGAEAVARRRAEQESQRLRQRAMDSVRERSVSVLTAVSSGRPSAPALCAQARLLEAELRDERRAPFFTGTAVVDAARAARARGIDVTLLDDRGPAEKAAGRIQDAVIAQAVRTLDRADGGHVVLRLLPPRQRPGLMSIVTADDVVLIAEDGRPVTRALA